ncbi:MAG: hypothetical protein NXY57DRAFT_624341 [Lentinula lateritia]|nr:MAG: hypothetical protein NXY57DRAFT_624341 [Lentinula lateritia]
MLNNTSPYVALSISRIYVKKIFFLQGGLQNFQCFIVLLPQRLSLSVIQSIFNNTLTIITINLFPGVCNVGLLQYMLNKVAGPRIFSSHRWQHIYIVHRGLIPQLVSSISKLVPSMEPDFTFFVLFIVVSRSIQRCMGNRFATLHFNISPWTRVV